MVTYVTRDGQRLTAWMAWCVDRLSADMHRIFGVWVKVRSGIRTYEEQKRIFLERYVRAGDVRGRRVYDTRWWNGALWYRISSAGTVAVPGSSNHEIEGTKAAVDLYDTGSDAGIATLGSARSNWLRANAAKYGLVASGFGFGEAWHYDVLNIANTPPGGSPASVDAPTPIELKDEMIRIQAPNRGIALIGPGYYRPLANDEEVNNSTPLITAHHTGNDRQFDLWVSMAIQGNIAGGVADIVRTESRPFKLHNTSKGLEAFGPGGKTWLVPSDAYRVLLDALQVAGPHVGRTLPDNERTFLITLLETLAPDPVNSGKVEAVLSISEEDAQRIASKIKVATPEQVADVLADRLAE